MSISVEYVLQYSRKNCFGKLKGMSLSILSSFLAFHKLATLKQYEKLANYSGWIAYICFTESESIAPHKALWMIFNSSFCTAKT